MGSPLVRHATEESRRSLVDARPTYFALSMASQYNDPCFILNIYD
jgi:hypothetical protein